MEDEVQDDVAIVTTATPKRLSALDRMRQLWDGPLAAIVYLSDYGGNQAQVQREETADGNGSKMEEYTCHCIYCPVQK